MHALLSRSVIIAFCLWHMTAVGLYSLSPLMGDPISGWLYDNVRPYMRPYILTLSQWQRWNLFAPNPTRRVVNFAIDVQEDGVWKERSLVAAHTVEWWRKSPELKIMRTLEKEERLKPLRERYVLLFCSTLDLPPGTHLRLRKQFYMIPKNETRKSAVWWREWTPQWKETIDVQTSCPPTTT